MTNDTYQDIIRAYGDTVGVNNIEEFATANCRQRYGCNGRCNGPGYCEKGLAIGGPTDQRQSWRPRKSEGCRGPAETGGPVVVE
jgi:hypothetical protein